MDIADILVILVGVTSYLVTVTVAFAALYAFKTLIILLLDWGMNRREERASPAASESAEE